MRPIFPLALAGLLTACNPAAESPPFDGDGSDGPGFTGGTLWVCDTGEAIRTQTRGGAIAIALDDGTDLDLPLIDGPGRGTTYAADGWVWVDRGGGAILTQQGGQSNCAPATQAEFDEALERRRALPPGPPVAGFDPEA